MCQVQPRVRSAVATGGVYKGQGRIRSRLVTDSYEAFQIHAVSTEVRSRASAAILTTVLQQEVRRTCRVRVARADVDDKGPHSREYGKSRRRGRIVSTIVARVRPRTSEGITDLLLPILDTTLPCALTTLGIYPRGSHQNDVCVCSRRNSTGGTATRRR